ncbi:MAG: response regulator, partial [Nitrososphaera sp.]|nr:response regulator [Nitrososphaera sp.]
ALEEGPTKKTRLATVAKLNYKVCMRYIRMLKVLGWVDVLSSGESEQVSITEMGRHVSARLLDDEAIRTAVARATYGHAVNFENGAKPFGQPPHVEKRIEPGRSIPLSRRVRHIMVVDDEPDILVTFQSYLMEEGYEVQVFPDAYSALRDFAARPSHYHLVVLDIRMPELNGLQLYQSLKAMNPSVRVFFVTAVDAAKEICSVLPGIASDDILRKPVERETFLKKVSQAVN